MKILKYVTLALVLLNLPTMGNTVMGSTVGALLSVLFFGCITLYYFLNKKETIPLIFILIGVFYFLISGINYSGVTRDFFIDALKYFFFIIGSSSLIRDTTRKELGIIIFIGAFSIIINAVVFSTAYGRYGGLYENPNRAGLACLAAFSLSFIIKHNVYKLIIQLIIVIAGIMTLSRTFFLILLTINLIAIIGNRKNSISLIAGTSAIIFVIALSSILNLNTKRFEAFESLFSNEKVQTRTISEGSRNETWALYTDVILDNAVTGNGYKTLHGNHFGIYTGVHNTYLMVLGEAGIILFLMFIFTYTFLFIKSIKYLKEHVEYVCLAFTLMTNLLVTHNYFDNYIVLFLSVWLYQRVSNHPDEKIPLKTT